MPILDASCGQPARRTHLKPAHGRPGRCCCRCCRRDARLPSAVEGFNGLSKKFMRYKHSSIGLLCTLHTPHARYPDLFTKSFHISSGIHRTHYRKSNIFREQYPTMNATHNANIIRIMTRSRKPRLMTYPYPETDWHQADPAAS